MGLFLGCKDVNEFVGKTVEEALKKEEEGGEKGVEEITVSEQRIQLRRSK